MKTFAIASAAFLALSVTAGTASAGGWKHNGYSSQKNSLINVSPTVDLGNVLSGIGVLNNSAVASGNVVSGILSGNNTGVGAGVLGGVSNLLGNKSKRGRR